MLSGTNDELKENEKSLNPKNKEENIYSEDFINQASKTQITSQARMKSNKSLSFESQYPNLNYREATRPKSISDSFEAKMDDPATTLYFSNGLSRKDSQQACASTQTREMDSINRCNDKQKVKYINQLNSETGKSQLHEAVIAKDISKIINVLNLGGSIDLRDSNGHTPLHEAFLNGDQKIVETLLSFGADPKLITHSHKNIAHLAASGNHRSLIALIAEKKLDELLFLQPDRDGYLPISYLKPKLEHYKNLRTFMLCYYKFNFNDTEESINKPVSGIKTLLSRLRSGSFLSSNLSSRKYTSPNYKLSDKNSENLANLPFSSNVNIRQQYLVGIKSKSVDIDNELLYIGFKSVVQRHKYYSGKETYKRLIQKYIFAKNIDLKSSTKKLKKRYATSLDDIKYVTYSLQKLYDKVGIHEILAYINQYFSKRDFEIQLHCIYFVKELILSMKIANQDQRKFGQELKIFLKKIPANIPALIKIKRNLQMLYFSDLQPLYNSINQEISLQNELAYSPRRHSSPLGPNNSYSIYFEKELNKVAAGSLKPDDEEYQMLLHSVSQDLVFHMTKLFVQINPTNLLNYSANKPPVIMPGFNPKTGVSNLEPISEIIKTSEKLSIMIAYDILSYDLPGRARVWDFYTYLIATLLEGQATQHVEINCICALIFGQLKNQIARLSETKNGLSQITKDLTKSFEQIAQVNANFNYLRKYDFNKNNYPVLFLFTKDLTSLNEIENQEDRMIAIGKLAFNFFEKAENALINDFLYVQKTDFTERLDNIRLKFLVEYEEKRNFMIARVISEQELQSYIEERLYDLSIQLENHTQTIFGDEISPDSILAILNVWQSKPSVEKESNLFLQQLSSLLEWNKEKMHKLDDDVSLLSKELKQKIDLKKKHHQIVGLADNLQKEITKTCPLRQTSNVEVATNSAKAFGRTNSKDISLELTNIQTDEAAQCNFATRIERRTPRRFELPLFGLSSKQPKNSNDLCLAPTSFDAKSSEVIKVPKYKSTV